MILDEEALSRRIEAWTSPSAYKARCTNKARGAAPKVQTPGS
jgi:hypothetical protein